MLITLAMACLMQKEKFYSTKEVADLLGFHPETILRYIKDGKIKPVKWLNSRICLIPKSAIADLIGPELTKKVLEE